ncbi:MAG: transferase [Lachnospiraceae bacterium]|nr:transferase [Lachnospiraceae bacterium]
MTGWMDKLQQVLRHQLNTFFMEGADEGITDGLVAEAAEAAGRCVDAYSLGEAKDSKDTPIRPFHSLEYCVFLYWMSRMAYLEGKSELASYVYYLNKSLNCVELFYEVELPPTWYCEHPLGSVMGKAEYGDCFFFYQGCTVGGNIKKDGSSIYPVIGSHVKMMSNSKVLGDSHIGNNVIISANTYIKDQDVPDDVIVFGQSPDLKFAANHYRENSTTDNILTR